MLFALSLSKTPTILQAAPVILHFLLPLAPFLKTFFTQMKIGVIQWGCIPFLSEYKHSIKRGLVGYSH